MGCNPFTTIANRLGSEANAVIREVLDLVREELAVRRISDELNLNGERRIQRPEIDGGNGQDILGIYTIRAIERGTRERGPGLCGVLSVQLGTFEAIEAVVTEGELASRSMSTKTNVPCSDEMSGVKLLDIARYKVVSTLAVVLYRV